MTPKPRRHLPIAARPAMLSLGVRVIVRGIIIEQFDVGDQCGARKQRFEQIVTKQSIFRNLLRQRFFESIDLIQALSGVISFAKEILINVGDSCGIGIYSSIPGKDAGKP